MMLTDSKLRKLKPPSDKASPDKYSDANGLQLHVFPTGRMTWIYAYRFKHKQKTLTLGGYPLVSLQEARRKHEDARRMLLDGVDPSESKKAKQIDQSGENTFAYVAMDWYAKKSPAWAAGNAKKVLARLNKDILPFLGTKIIAEINAPALLAVIQRIEARSVDTAYRALQECGQIFRYGMAIGKNNHDPSPALKGALSKRQIGHFAAIIEPNEVGGLLRAIEGFNGSFVVKCALQLAPMFFVRIGDALGTAYNRTKFLKQRKVMMQQWADYLDSLKDNVIPFPKQA